MTCSTYPFLNKFLPSAPKVSKAKYGTLNLAKIIQHPKKSIKKLKKRFDTFDQKIVIHKTHITVSEV